SVLSVSCTPRPRVSTLFPYTTLFRSGRQRRLGDAKEQRPPLRRTATRRDDSFVLLEDVGDTEFLIDEQTDKFRFLEENERVISRSEEHTSELQSRRDLVCRLLLEKKK